MTYKSFVIIISLVLASICQTTFAQKIPGPERRVFELINDFRASNGLPRLKYLKRKQWQVDLWARHISKRFEHAKRGYTCENIAFNYDSPAMLFYQWQASPGHRRNMLLGRITNGVVGIYSEGLRYFGVFRGYVN